MEKSYHQSIKDNTVSVIFFFFFFIKSFIKFIFHFSFHSINLIKIEKKIQSFTKQSIHNKYYEYTMKNIHISRYYQSTIRHQHRLVNVSTNYCNSSSQPNQFEDYSKLIGSEV